MAAATTVAATVSTATTATGTTRLFVDKTYSTFFKPLTKTSSFTFTHKISAKNPISYVISSFESHPTDQNPIFDDDDKPREECGVVGIYVIMS
ncbi:hypothetical protein R6Q59_001591 [Mikania micrantha]